MFLVCQPTPTSRVNDVLGKADFWKALQLKRSVGRSMVYHIATIAECLAKGPTMRWQRNFSEKKKIQECWSNIVMMLTKEGMLAPAF